MKTRTFIRAALIRLVILAGILIGLTVIVNLPWFDEELHEDLARLATPRDVTLDGNAYPLILGFQAPADQDPREKGLQIIQAQREHFRTHRHTSMPGRQASALRREGMSLKGMIRLNDYACNAKVELDCVDRLNEAVATTPVTDGTIRLLLERFDRVLEEPRYEETQEFDYQLMPNYGRLVAVSRIRLAEQFRDEDASRILQAIGEDSRFWKRMLDGGETLIAKMIALAGLRNDTMALSTLMRSGRLKEADLRQLPAILPPLTESERNIGEAFMAETRFLLLSEGGLDALSGSNFLLRLVSQDNASLNAYYTALMLPLRLRASLSATEFYRQKAYEPLRHQVRLMPPPLYNFGGKQLLKIAAASNNWQFYVARVHDVDGRIALAQLQAEIALHADRSVEEIVQASRYRNPYTGEPMDYDATAGTISFPCLGGGEEVCALRIR